MSESNHPDGVESAAGPSDLRALGRDLRRGLALTAVLMSLISGGLSAAIIKALGLEDALTLWELFLRTAPLTLALTMSSLVWVLWVSRDGKEAFFKWLFTLGLGLWAATLIGNRLGALRVEVPPYRYDPQDPVSQVMNLGIVRYVRAFYSAYGGPAFWSSVILSAFLVYAALRTLSVLSDRRKAVR